jgi:hypothetical protein
MLKLKRRTFLKLLGLGLTSVPTLTSASLLGADSDDVGRSGDVRIFYIGNWSVTIGELMEYNIALNGKSVDKKDRIKTRNVLLHPVTFEPVIAEHLLATEKTRISIETETGLMAEFYPEWDEEKEKFKDIRVEYVTDGRLYYDTTSKKFVSDGTHACLSVYSGGVLINDTSWDRCV